MIRLVTDVRSTLGVETADSVKTETEFYKQAAAVQETAERDLHIAVRDLYDVGADKFDAARTRVIEATARLSSCREAESQVTQAAGFRLRRAIFDEVPVWEAAVVERFNEVVDHQDLNTAGRELPNFADPGRFHAAAMSQAHGRALDLWRSAVVHLEPLWGLYKRLVTERGDQLLGPAGADDFATNAITACALGTPESFGQVESAAVIFASVSRGSSSAKAYGPLMPFAIPSIVGYNWRLSTITEAANIKNQLQTGKSLSFVS
jgi:hypothetical protein